MPEHDPHNAEFNLVMPFVVVKSEGGPFDDRSFVAGIQYERTNYVLQIVEPLGYLNFQAFVYKELIPQLDLLAMNLGWILRTESCDDNVEFCKTHKDERNNWILAIFEIPNREELIGE